MTITVPKLVGIVNLTPDSFSDGGQYATAAAALAHITALLDAGADVIDLGAESTRPGANRLSAEEEWRRLAPVLDALTDELHRRPFKLSVDTYHPETARRALACGAHWINDVTGFRDPDMVDAVRQAPCDLVVMHALSVPVIRGEHLPEETDVVDQVLHFAEERLAALEAQGIDRRRLLFDPGIGFGKTAQQSTALIREIRRFHALGVPLHVGHSRKSFLSLFTDAPAGERDVETLAISLYLANQGVAYLRVHDVAAHRRALTTAASFFGWAT